MTVTRSNEPARRRFRILLACAGLVAVALTLGIVAPAGADTVVFKGGHKLEGTVLEEGPGWIRFKTRFGTQKIERSRIREIIAGKTREQEFADRRAGLDLDDLAGHVELALWAKTNKLKRESQELFEYILVLDPDHALSRRELGHVKYNGDWITKEEHERIQEAEWKAKGYVKKGGRWVPADEVTPEPRGRRGATGSSEASGAAAGAKSAPDASGLAGRVGPGDDWLVPNGEIAKAGMAEIEDAIGVTPIAVSTKHFVFISLLPEEQTRELAALAETTIRWVFEFLEDNPDIRPWVGQGRYYLFDQANNYEDFITYVVPKHIEDKRFLLFLQRSQSEGKSMGLSARTEGIPFAADFDQAKTPWANLIHAKVSTFCLENYSGRVPAWLRCGWAAFAEFQFTGASRVRALTNATYGGRADLADKASDSKFWQELLADAVEHEEDTHFLEFKNRKLNQLDYMDLSKSWSLITWMVESRKEAFVNFCRGLRQKNPDDAFRDALGQDYDGVDAAWREWMRGE